MKASKDQIDFIHEALQVQYNRAHGKLNLPIDEISSINTCWQLLHRQLESVSELRPIGVGNARDWKLNGLNDSHIESVFRYLVPKLRPPRS